MSRTTGSSHLNRHTDTRTTVDPHEYAATYGPRAGDRIRLGDTGLVIRVESDAQRPGDEFLAGFGKTARDGLHLKAAAVRDTCDVVISNVVVIDAAQGVRKVSIGIREGRIHAIGRAGNPDTLDGVDVVVGTGTTIVSGEGMIATAGAVDTHVHLLSPRVMEASLASGVTTVIGQEFGPVWGVGVNSPWALRHAVNAFDAWPVNIGFLARGSSSDPAPLVEALAEGGACGFKVHEDMGAHARALDTALRVAEDHDVQVALHSDGLNECLTVEDTLRVLDGRTIHAFHIEGCGGGHVPNVLKMAGVGNVIGSSTNPTLPFGRDAVAEHYGMIVSVHGLKPDLPGDAAMARDRIRAGTMGAEDVLHDLGAIGITSSDAQGMGRAGETVARTFAMAAKMKAETGPLPGDGPADDNGRVLRYIAKLTINPAIAHGLAHEIGSIETGKLADIVLWHPRYFGAKPQLVLKAGFPAYGVTGDPNAATDTCEPLVLGPQFGAYGATAADLSVVFTASAAAEAAGDRMPTRRRRVAVRGTRGIGPADLVLNSRTGSVDVDPRSGLVTLDGEPLRSDPAEQVALSRLYFL
ncbi:MULTISPECIES: urease subunit alpha [Streptomycetaceae]|uniref:Urease subunit alpha n=1 Tax=Streptantibioticus cattleyicolor (strain ATCC 35852 / DSM 46488 / JCM 4925 / NBRC 14057 / NRRL 8057) TaxID=1003195 RepID=F8JSJ2_STREN|nr:MULTISPECIES: urease subunit alpha [Streptomycetaceae]AEW96717.1 urease subunit alpha 1 [Streptantibioticus cattleyicolor NRRL 8057 = DSM 46488]MYS61205.1 urease subunit alpha [Streptomyces sp. SID5468]CCB77054.1 urease (alpha subunit) [Streptantibioticus cattleyicolor NRRL 8057 = DSM 46488]